MEDFTSKSITLSRSEGGFAKLTQSIKLSQSDGFSRPSQPHGMTSSPKPNEGPTSPSQSIRPLSSDDGFPGPSQYSRSPQLNRVASPSKPNDGPTRSPKPVQLLRDDDGFFRPTQSIRMSGSGDGFARPSPCENMISLSKPNDDLTRPSQSVGLLRSPDGFSRPTHSIGLSRSGGGYIRPSQSTRPSQGHGVSTRPSQFSNTFKGDDGYPRSYQLREQSRHGNASQFTRPSQSDSSFRSSSFSRRSQSDPGLAQRLNKHPPFNKTSQNIVHSQNIVPPNNKPLRRRNPKPSGPFTDSLEPLEPLGPISQTLPPLDPAIHPEWELFNDPDIIWGERKVEPPELGLPSKYWFGRVLAAPKLLRPASVLPIPDKPEKVEESTGEGTEEAEVKGEKNSDGSSIDKKEEGTEEAGVKGEKNSDGSSIDKKGEGTDEGKGTNEGKDKKENKNKVKGPQGRIGKEGGHQQKGDTEGNTQDNGISGWQLQPPLLRDTNKADDSWKLIPRISVGEKLKTKQPHPHPHPHLQNGPEKQSLGVEGPCQLQPQGQPPNDLIDSGKENQVPGNGSEGKERTLSPQPQVKPGNMNEKLVLERSRHPSQWQQQTQHPQKREEDMGKEMRETKETDYTLQKDRQGRITALSSSGKVLEKWKVKIMKKKQKKHQPTPRPWECRGEQRGRKF